MNELRVGLSHGVRVEKLVNEVETRLRSYEKVLSRVISKEGDVDRVCDIYRQIIITFVQNVATINYAFY